MDKLLKNKKLFLLDMDGTVYIEQTLIPGAKEFLDALIRQNKRYVFLTNNSSKNVIDYVKKLNSLGIIADSSNIFSSSQATALYLKENNFSINLYVVGTDAFKEELTSFGFNIIENTENVKVLVVGFDTELTYRKIQDACELIDAGIPYIATNPDLVCPISNGKFIPDCGAICNMLELATNKLPKYIGKPRKEMVEIVAKKEKTNLDDIAIVGDRLYTDIACGLNAGITNAVVLTGETKKEHLKDTSFTPDFVFDSINDLYKIIK